MINKRPNIVAPVPSAKPNGHDELDPRITATIALINQTLSAQQDMPVGVVVAAFGVLLGRKMATYEHLEHMIADLGTASRVGFYLSKVRQ